MLNKISWIFFTSFVLINANPFENNGQSTSVEFLQSKTSEMRRVNPLKLFFTVVFDPKASPSYKVEWNFPLIKTILIKSQFVSDQDKIDFLVNFDDALTNYGNWTDEKHLQFERFTEKFFNLYKPMENFLPVRDCPSLTFGIMNQILSDLKDNVRQHYRAMAIEKAIESLCVEE